MVGEGEYAVIIDVKRKYRFGRLLGSFSKCGFFVALIVGIATSFSCNVGENLGDAYNNGFDAFVTVLAWGVMLGLITDIFCAVRARNGGGFFRRHILKKKADRGDTVAQYEYGMLMRETNIRMAIFYLEEAAKKGYVEAMVALGNGYSEVINDVGIFVGFGKDVMKEVEWFTKAAKCGNIYSMMQLGYIYSTGQNDMRKDETRALYWFEQAAMCGSEEGRNAAKDLRHWMELKSTY